MHMLQVKIFIKLAVIAVFSFEVANFRAFIKDTIYCSFMIKIFGTDIVIIKMTVSR